MHHDDNSVEPILLSPQTNRKVKHFVPDYILSCMMRAQMTRNNKLRRFITSMAFALLLVLFAFEH